MRKVSLLFAAIALVAGVGAAADFPLQKVVSDIQKGVDNANQIQTLRVLTDAVLPADSIETAEIEDGTIVNADISASAAIAQSKVALDADLLNVGTNKAVISRTGSTLCVDYGAATNNGTIAWNAHFAGTPSVVACYWGDSLTNTLGGYAAAQVKTCDATNAVVIGDAVDTAQYIYVIAVGVAEGL